MKSYLRIATPFLLVMLLTTGISRGQQTNHNGYWWADQSETFKLGFATGYSMAMTDASDGAALRCIAAKHGGTVPETVPSNEELDACLKSPEAAALNFGGVRFGQLAEGADEFYKDFRNKGVEIELAMRYVRDQLKGKTDKELTEELSGWRQTANK